MSPTMIGVLYIAIGVIGFGCNAATALMIITRRVFRLSAYTIMANVALADAIMTVVAGVACGIAILCGISSPIGQTEPPAPSAASILQLLNNSAENSTMRRVLRGIMPTPEEFVRAGLRGLHRREYDGFSALQLCLVFMEITAWMAGVVSYAYLGLNRCVAICFYGTKAKMFNRVSVALMASISTWVIGIVTACIATFPDSLSAAHLDVGFISSRADRPVVFVSIALAINVLSVMLQWVCSTLVLIKIRQVKQKISKNKLNQNSANRFRKQARLTFQFFYPSLLCTISSILYFAKPYLRELLPENHFVTLHLIWLCNHICNPFIYAYFNDRMRITYRDMLACREVRYRIRKYRKQRGFQRQNSRATFSRKSHGQRSHRMSARSAKSQKNGNFVRSSLQMQSRDFEQLCEFMMRVNPLYDSSEGWRESSDEEEYDVRPLETRSEQANAHRESRSIVMDLGRQTVEHWARFAKKASI